MKNLLIKSFAAAALLASVATSHAAIVVSESNSGSIDDNNVLFAGCNEGVAVQGPATMISGCLNDDRSRQVNFTSTDLISYAAGGQAMIQGTPNPYGDLTIGLTVGTFDTLILNIDTLNDSNTYVKFFGTPGGESDFFSLGGTGENYFTITGNAGEGFESVSFQIYNRVQTAGADTNSPQDNVFAPGAMGDFVVDVKQVRLGATPPANDVPEPMSLALMGVGLLGLGASRRLAARKAA